LSHGRSILLVAQLTPPSPLVGAHRPAALTKYLARRGHRVTVLTSMMSGRGAVPGAARVVRTRDLLSSALNWRRANLESLQGRSPAAYADPSPVERVVVPDLSVVGWLPFALPRALALGRRERFDCVITTSPPPSTHMIGCALRAAGTPWIADVRDGWTFDPPRPPWPTRPQALLDATLERLVLGTADRVVAVTAPIAHDLERTLGRPIAVITNGFDPEESRTVKAPDLDPARHSLVHTGRLNVVGRTPHALFDGLLEFVRRQPDGARALEVVLAGPVSADQERHLADRRLQGLVRSVGSLERAEALGLQRQADTLLVLAEGNDVRPSRSVATGKLFEYLGAGRPILVLGEKSEAARIVREVQAGVVAPGDDPGAIADVLERLVRRPVEPSPANLDHFAWPALAERFAEEIDAAISARGPVGPRRGRIR
jgi:glycosyltransferase involved in cell wall biosynthesis